MLRWADTGNWIGTFRGHQGAVWGATIDEAGEKAATASADFTAKLWNLETGVELASLQHAHVVKAVDFSNRKLLTGGLEKKALVFDLNDTSSPSLSLSHEVGVLHAFWLDEHVLTGGADGKLRQWDVRSPNAPLKTVSFGSSLADLDYLPHLGRLVATLSRKLVILDAKTLAAVHEIACSVDINAGSLSPNGQLVAAGGQDLCCHVYDVNAGRELAVLKGHHGPVFCLRWDTNTRFASGSEDGLIRLWEVSI